MSNANSWVNWIQNHKVFSYLNKIKNEENVDQGGVTKNLFTYRDGELFFWNEQTFSIYVFNLKYSALSDNNNFKFTYQDLVCSNPPRFPVYQLSLNVTGSSLALVGSEGIDMVTLPLYKTNRAESEGVEKFTCKSYLIDEMFFTTSGHRLHCFQWHPGFPNGNCLVTLTSDNFIRIYKLENPSYPCKKINLDSSAAVFSPTNADSNHRRSSSFNHSLSSSGLLQTKLVLGETFISFDFGEQLRTNGSENKKKKRLLNQQAFTKNDEQLSIFSDDNYIINVNINNNNNNNNNNSGIWKSREGISSGINNTGDRLNDNSYEKKPFTFHNERVKLPGTGGRVANSKSYDNVESGRGNNARNETASTEKLSSPWPVYLLLENGQIYICFLRHDYSSLNVDHSMIGPLKMSPAAEDNYGTDACSILYLSTTPPVLVVATCNTKIHQCILLDFSEDDDDDDDDSQLSIFKVGDRGSRNKNKDDILLSINWNPCLYVYETIDLELELINRSQDTNSSNIIDDFNCPIRLYSDPICKERYHCCHISGLHSIMLLWLNKLQDFFSADGHADLPQINQEDQTIVEHLICTKPLSSIESMAVVGFAQVSDRFLGPNIICLTSDNQCTVLPFLRGKKNTFQYMSNGLNVLDKLNPNNGERSFNEPMIGKGDLISKVERILSKKSSNPYIKGSLECSNSLQECFQLLCRTTLVFRQEYILRFSKAKDEIDQNVSRLLKVKENQEIELKYITKSKQEAIRTQEYLKKQLENILEKQRIMKLKINEISHGLERNLVVISDLEHSAIKELKVISDRVTKQQQFNVQIQKRLEEHSKAEANDSAENKSLIAPAHKSRVTLDKQKTKSIHSLLKKEGEEITSLMKEVKQLNTAIDQV